MNGERDANDVRFLLEHPLIVRTLDEMEQSSVNLAVTAPITDHEARQAHIAEVRAIRALRSKLKALSESTAKSNRKVSVA
jgi:anti-sigma factor RsiW